jgi:hypothetical protein
MLRKWHKDNRVAFEVVFMFLFAMIDVVDAEWFHPKMRPICNGEITDQQVKSCSGWIRKINDKEQKDVGTFTRGS